jgi:putative Mg2+ transporter-C (MgtC) family protein
MVLQWHADLMTLVRLLLAGALGALIGWERESVRKSAGLRTLALVGIGACLFMVSAELALGSAGSPSDPARAVQAVAIGIGFLGAGMARGGDSDRVRGLTTAATIWATAAIGVAAGLGRVVLAVGGAAIVLFVLRVMRRFDHHAFQPDESRAPLRPHAAR